MASAIEPVDGEAVVQESDELPGVDIDLEGLSDNDVQESDELPGVDIDLEGDERGAVEHDPGDTAVIARSPEQRANSDLSTIADALSTGDLLSIKRESHNAWVDSESERRETVRDDYVLDIFEKAKRARDSRYFRAREISLYTEVPVEAILKNYDRFESAIEDKKLDPRVWRYQNPDLYSLLINPLKKKRDSGLLIKTKEDSSLVRFFKMAPAWYRFNKADLIRDNSQSKSMFDSIAETLGLSATVLEETDLETLSGGLGPMVSIEERLKYQAADFRQMERESAIDQGYREGRPTPKEYRESDETGLSSVASEIGRAWENMGIGILWRKIQSDELILLDAIRRDAPQSEIESINRRLEHRLKSVQKRKEALGADKLYINNSGFQNVLADAGKATGSGLSSIAMGTARGLILGGVVGGAVLYKTKDLGKAFASGRDAAMLFGGVATGAHSWSVNSGFAFERNLRLRDPDGFPLDPETANHMANYTGFFNMVLEVGTLPIIAGGFGKVGTQLLKGSSLDFSLELAKNASIGSILVGGGRGLLVTGGVEGVEEGLQSINDSVSDYANRLILAPDLAEFELGSVLGEAASESYYGLLGGLVLGTGSTAIGMAADIVAYNADADRTAVTQKIIDLTTDPDIQESPALSAAAIKDFAAESGYKISDPHINPKVLQEYANKTGKDPEEFYESVLGPGGAQQVSEAFAAQNDEYAQRATLRLSLEKFIELRRNAPELSSDIRKHTVFAADAATPIEVASASKVLLETIERYTDKDNPVEPAGEYEVAFIDAIRKKLSALGVAEDELSHFTDVQRAMVYALRAKSPEAAEDVFQNLALDIAAHSFEINEEDVADLVDGMTARLSAIIFKKDVPVVEGIETAPQKEQEAKDDAAKRKEEVEAKSVGKVKAKFEREKASSIKKIKSTLAALKKARLAGKKPKKAHPGLKSIIKHAEEAFDLLMDFNFENGADASPTEANDARYKEWRESNKKAKFPQRTKEQIKKSNEAATKDWERRKAEAIKANKKVPKKPTLIKQSPTKTAKPAPLESLPNITSPFNRHLKLKGNQRITSVREGVDKIMRNKKFGDTMYERMQYVMRVMDETSAFGDILIPEHIELHNVLSNMTEEDALLDELKKLEESQFEWGVPFSEAGRFYGLNLFTGKGGEWAGTIGGFLNTVRSGVKTAFGILLSRDAEHSTMMHEMAHMYLRMLGEIAAHPKATNEVKEHLAAVLDVVGSKDGVITEEQDELFAKMFESFMFNGSAPSIGLVGAFEKYKRFMSTVYSYTYTTVKLDKKSQKLFNKMLATDRQLENMKAATGLDLAIYKTFKDAGVDPKEMESFVRDQERLNSLLTQKLLKKIAKEQEKALRKFKSARFKRLQAAHEEAYELYPTTRAKKFIYSKTVVRSDGTVFSEVSGENFPGWDKSAIEALPETDAKKKAMKSVVEDGGIDPEETVGHFTLDSDKNTFTDAAHMFAAASRHESKKEWAKKRAAEEFAIENPTYDGDLASVEELVAAVVHDEEVEKFIIKEIISLDRLGKLNKDPESSIAMAKVAAKRQVESEIITDVNPKSTLTQERNASKAAIRRALDKNFLGAFYSRLRQILHMQQYRERVDAVKLRKSLVQNMKDLRADTRNRIMGKAGDMFLHTVHQVLDQMGIKDAPETSINPEAIQDLIRHMLENGKFRAEHALVISDFSVGVDGLSSFTVREADILNQALNAIYNEARSLTTTQVGATRVNDENIIRGIHRDLYQNRRDLGNIGTVGSSVPLLHNKLLSNQEKVQSERFMDRFQALLDIAELTRRMGSTFKKAIYDPFKVAQDLEIELLNQQLGKIEELQKSTDKSVFKGMRKRLRHLDKLPMSERTGRSGVGRTRGWMIALAFQMGNGGNVSRMEEGHSWSEADIWAFFKENEMSDEEMGYVQGMWDILENLWPHLRGAYKSDTGLDLQRVKNRPFVFNGKKYRGGFYPIKFDSTASGRPRGEDTFDRARSNISKTFTKERVDKSSFVVDLNIDNTQRHISDVIYYIAFNDWVRNSRKLLEMRNVLASEKKILPGDSPAQVLPDTKPTVDRYLGHGAYGQIKSWIDRVAGGVPSVEGTAGMDAMLLRANGILRFSALGFHSTIPFADIVNPVMAITTVKPHLLAWSALTTIPRILNPIPGQSQYGWFKENSAEMARRGSRAKQDINRHLLELKNKHRQNSISTVYRNYLELGFMFQRAMSFFSEATIFRASYLQHRKTMSEEEAKKKADFDVSLHSPTHDVREQSSAQANRGMWTTLTIFMSFFMKLHNVQSANLDILKQDLNKAHGLENVTAVGAFGFRMGTIFAGVHLLAEIIAGHGPEDDEPLEYWMLRRALVAPVIGVPVLGQLAERASYEAVDLIRGEDGGEGRNSSFRTAPIFAIAEQVGRGWMKLKSDEITDEERWLNALAPLMFITKTMTMPQYRALSGALAEEPETEGIEKYILGPKKRRETGIIELIQALGGEYEYKSLLDGDR